MFQERDKDLGGGKLFRFAIFTTYLKISRLGFILVGCVQKYREGIEVHIQELAMIWNLGVRLFKKNITVKTTQQNSSYGLLHDPRASLFFFRAVHGLEIGICRISVFDGATLTG